MRFIVVLLSVGVLSFGVFTVYNVLHDSTSRKRGMIGIIRVMGVSRLGVFYFVFLRAITIGIVSGLVTVALGYLLQWPLASLDKLAVFGLQLFVTLATLVAAAVSIMVAAKVAGRRMDTVSWGAPFCPVGSDPTSGLRPSDSGRPAAGMVP